MRRMVAGIMCAVIGVVAVTAWGELTPDQTKAAQTLIAQFTSPEFAVRQKAVEELIKMGPAVLPLVRKTLAETKDPEVKLRCEMVIEGITRKQGVGQKAEVDARKLVEKRVKSLGPVGRVMWEGIARVPICVVAWNPGKERLASLLSQGLGEGFTVFLDGKELGHYEAATSFHFSPDGKHYNYMVVRDEKWRLVHDGKEGAGYEMHQPPRFSADGQHLAYAARLGEDRWTLVYDGKEGPVYDAMGVMQFSPDGKHLVYVARRGVKDFVVLDGKELLFNDKAKPFEPHEKALGGNWWLGQPVFSPDSHRLAYLCSRDRSQFVTCNGEEGPRYEWVGGPMFSPDSKRMAYLAKRGGRMLVVCDGKEGQTNRTKVRPAFSPDSKRFAYEAARDGRECIVCDGKEEAAQYDAVAGVVFSPDSQHLAYTARRGGQAFVVLDGKEIEAHRGATYLVFSPDSKRLAYVAQEEGMYFVVCDGKKSLGYESVMPPFFTPDSEHILSRGWREKQRFVIVDGVEGPTHASVMLPDLWERTEEWFQYLKDGGKLRYIVIDDDGAWVVEADWPKDQMGPIEPRK